MRIEVRNRILKQYGNKCCYCGSENKLEIDHIIPISKGGREDERNMQVLCKRCNISKGNRINILDWFIYDPISDLIYISKELPLHSFKPHELKAAIELLFDYKS